MYAPDALPTIFYDPYPKVRTGTPKDFAKLLEELKADAGTRYNPDIVAIIDSKPRLQQELADLTVGGRYSVYYEAYREIREL